MNNKNNTEWLRAKHLKSSNFQNTFSVALLSVIRYLILIKNDIRFNYLLTFLHNNKHYKHL
jgi:hypothetical protein